MDDDVDAALRAASEHFRAGRYEASLAALRGVEDRVGDDPSVRWNIARCLEELGRVEAAIDAFERVVREAPTPDEARAGQAHIDALMPLRPGRVVVDCALGHVSLGPDAPERPCPATFEGLPPGPVEGWWRTAGGGLAIGATVRPGETVRVEPQLPQVEPAPEDGITVWPLIASGVMLAAGVGLMWAARVTAEGAQEAIARGDRPAYDAARSDFEGLSGVGYAAYGLAAALAGVQVWVWVDERDARSGAGAAAGLIWGGRF